MNPMAKATAGYSGTPLAKKLGTKADDRLLPVRAPDGFGASIAPLPAGVTVRSRARATDGTWSGLRFVVRREARTSWPTR